MAGVDPRPVTRSAPAAVPLRERLSALWPKASLRAYLAAIMLLATVPFIALMGYRIYQDFGAQRARMWAELERTTAATAQLSVPVIAALGGIVFLGEAPTLRLLFASVAVLGGIALVVVDRPTVRA